MAPRRCQANRLAIAIEPTHGHSAVLIREEAIRFARDILRHYGESP